MAGHADRPTAKPAGDEPPGGRSAGEPDAERFGPLATVRRCKDDGRALIVYARVRDAGPAPAWGENHRDAAADAARARTRARERDEHL